MRLIIRSLPLASSQDAAKIVIGKGRVVRKMNSTRYDLSRHVAFETRLPNIRMVGMLVAKNLSLPTDLITWEMIYVA